MGNSGVSGKHPAFSSAVWLCAQWKDSLIITFCISLKVRNRKNRFSFIWGRRANSSVRGDGMKPRVSWNSGSSMFTFSSRVPQHGVGHHHHGPPEDVGQHKDVELLQTLVDGFVRGLHPKDNDTARTRVQNALFLRSVSRPLRGAARTRWCCWRCSGSSARWS